MNSNQKKVIIGLGVVIFSMVAYAPYNGISIYGKGNRIEESGYAFLVDIASRSSEYSWVYFTVNYPILFIEIFGALIVGGLAYLALKTDAGK